MEANSTRVTPHRNAKAGESQHAKRSRRGNNNVPTPPKAKPEPTTPHYVGTRYESLQPIRIRPPNFVRIPSPEDVDGIISWEQPE